MKKIFFLLLFVLAFNSSDAKNRTTEVLKEIAASFINMQKTNRSRKTKAVPSDMTIAMQKEQLAIVANDDFFVVLALNDDVEPILGYSETNYNDSIMPPGFQWWLNAADETLSNCNNNSIQSSIELPDDFPQHVNPLISTKWSQWSPYNDKIPLYILPENNSRQKVRSAIITPPENGKDSTECPTGCVATAMAQIMNYHKYPDHGELRHAVAMEHGDGSISFVGVDFENTHFNWSNMIDKYSFTYSWDYELSQEIKTPNFTEAQGESIATLMLACGVSCDTNYKPKGSSATLPNAAKALGLYFNYNQIYLSRNSITDNIWMKIIYKFNHLKLPILYSGSGNGAHAFVIDGYDENGNVHVNWGWSGKCDGFYNINALNPSLNNSNYNFSSNQSMVLLRPATFSIDVKEINVSIPGTLSSMLLEYEYDFIEGLKVSGDIDGSDIRALRKMCESNLCSLDLSNANIVEGGSWISSMSLPCYRGITYNDAFPDCAFGRCDGLSEIILPKSIKSVGEYAFYYCSNLKSVTIPNGVTAIGHFAFSGCSGLTSIEVDRGNNKYDSRNNCNAIIETATNKLIAGCRKTIIPNEVTSIDYYAFSRCIGLTSVTIPNNVTEISCYAFEFCSSLTDVYCYAENVPNTDGWAFYKSPIASATLHVPAASIEAYRTTEPWSSFGSIVPLTDEDAIEDVNEDTQSVEVARYDLQGRRQSTPQRGINIIRTADGTTRKMMVK